MPESKSMLHRLCAHGACYKRAELEQRIQELDDYITKGTPDKAHDSVIKGSCMLARIKAESSVKQLEQEIEENDQLLRKLSDILTRTVNVLKGEPAELHSHSWHDLPEVAQALKEKAGG